MLQEILSLGESEIWEEEVPPKGANLFSTKLVDTVKLNADATIERFKARLIAREFSQVHGMDYTETFAPTVRMDTLRLFLARVAKEDLECNHFESSAHVHEKIRDASPPRATQPRRDSEMGRGTR
ncbi:hypothetical protein K3495_g3094 [Podosphaera aphanis]|nr:hypothetical protein K3495_g3094 [Podosphaera aphanis]